MSAGMMSFADQLRNDQAFTTIQSTPPKVTQKVTATLLPGQSIYEIRHGLRTEDIIVQTRIAGRIREGGVSITNDSTVRLTFGGTLNEALDVVIVG